MISAIFRRLSFSVVLSLAAFFLPVVSHAQATGSQPPVSVSGGGTGTDPCPPGLHCTITGSAATTPASAGTTPNVTTGSAVQVLMVLLGLA